MNQYITFPAHQDRIVFNGIEVCAELEIEVDAKIVPEWLGDRRDGTATIEAIRVLDADNHWQDVPSELWDSWGFDVDWLETMALEGEGATP